MQPDKDFLKRHPSVIRLYASILGQQLQKEGPNYVALCPMHPDKSTKSFKIKVGPEDRNYWHCFGTCSRGGDIFDLLMLIKPDRFKSYSDAVSFVREYVEKNATSWDKDKDKVDAIFKPLSEEKKEYRKIDLKWYLDHYVANLMNSSEAQEWLMRERGITLETAVRLNLGYIKNLGEKLGQDLADKGWISLPYIDNEQVILLKYRSMAKKDYRRFPGMETTLFNLPTIDAFDSLYTCEGEFDASILEQAGFHAISLPAGTNSKYKSVITSEMRDRIMEANEIILAGDNDPTGIGTMDKLWNELDDCKKVRRLVWPEGCKDANATFLTKCKGDVQEFKKLVEELSAASRLYVMKNVYSLQQAMLLSGRTNLADDPRRLRFPWPSVDNMAILLPGSVMAFSATQTKQGKSTFILQSTLNQAMQYKEVILNYQCELTRDELACIATSHLLQRNRNHLTHEDYIEASKLIAGIQYYIGRDETLRTITPVLDLIEAAIKRLGATVVVLDHFHFVCRNVDNQIQEEENAFQRIKQMAGKYKIKFIVIGQPRKARQSEKGKMIHITDLKGSEVFGSDSDAIFILHRDLIVNSDPDNPPVDDYEPDTKIVLLAARSKGDGATEARLYYTGTLATFREMDEMTFKDKGDAIQDNVQSEL
jgi:hypothetical protein